jgi:hypothetical protein
MLSKNTKLTPALQAWLMQGGDAGRFLYGEEIGGDLKISARLRMGCFETPISESEVRHAIALLAAHAVEPLNMPTPDGAVLPPEPISGAAQEKVDFEMFSAPTRDPEDTGAIRKWRAERKLAAWHAFQSARAAGMGPDACKGAAAAAAALVPKPEPADSWRDES